MEALKELLKHEESMLEHYEDIHKETKDKTEKNIYFGYIECSKLHIRNIKDKIQIYGDK